MPSFKILALLALLLIIVPVVAEEPTCPVNLATMFDVTGDGTDESAELNAAFDYTRSVGTCKVTFPADAIIRINSTVNMSEYLELDGQNATLKVSDNHGDGSGIYMVKTATNDWWHDLNYNGNYPAVGGSIDYGVGIADGVLIEDSTFRNMTEYGLQGFHTDNWVFRNNLIENSTQYGISTGGSTGWSDNVTVTGNTIKWCKEVGVKVRGTRDSTISYNKITLTTSGTGLRFYTNDAPVEDTVIESNIITSDPASGTTYGLMASPGDYCIGCVMRNNSVDGAYYGVYAGQANDNSSVLIEDNTFTNTRRASVLLYGDNTRFYDNIFDRGIYIGGGSGYAPTNNTFHGNTIQSGIKYSNALYGPGDGIFFWSANATNNTIDSNTISVDRYGINIDNRTGIAYNTTVTNNKVSASWQCIVDNGVNTQKSGNTCNGEVFPPWWHVWAYYLKFHLAEFLI